MAALFFHRVKLNIYVFASLLFIAILFNPGAEVYAQAGTYYDLINTSSASFITELKTRVRSPYTKVSYDNFDETNIANFAAIDNGNGTKSVFCVYTSYEFIYSGTFAWTTMSREHTFCHSWMPTYSSTSVNEYSDQHHLFPTHQNNANGRRSNHPLGIVTNPSYTFMDGKLGTNASSQVVYEPRDKQKGDAARAILYMFVRYDDVNGYTWNMNALNARLISLPEPEAPQSLQTLLDWNKQDPPDKIEIDRVNYIQSIQGNRNPFVDHPEYVNFISFNDLTKLSPSYSTEPTNYPTSLSTSTTGSSVQVSWTDAAAGSQVPSGYLIQIYKANNYFLPIDGETYSDDADLSDGKGIVNVSYDAANSYTFNTGLTSNTTYYVTIYSYNGTGTSRNYKINNTLPQVTGTTSSTSSTSVNLIGTSTSVLENAGSVTLTVGITNPSASVACSVQVALTSGSSSDLNNYTTQTVVFPANSSANQTLNVTITDDAFAEGDEGFVFTLQTATGGNSASIGANSTYSLTIQDNDVTTVQFTSESATVSEGSGSYNLTVSITNPSPSVATTATIVLASGNTGDVGNYTAQTVTFPANSSANQNLTITITDDSETEESENFEFSIESVSGGGSALIGSPNLFTLTITDNENIGPPWNYNFGTGIGTFNTNSASTSFIPAPAANGGTSRVRVGSGGGYFNIDNPGIEGFGSETELKGVAPTSTSVNKFSIYDYTAGKAFTIKFDLRLNGGTSGTWYFFAGDGACYSDGSQFSTAQVFTGIRWAYGTSNSITTNYRSGSSWVSTGITGAPFSQGVNYSVEIYGNNTTASANYTYNTSQSVAANKFDLWLNGTLIGNDLAKAGLTDDMNIDSWMFYGESSTGNVATIYLDNIYYSNSISDNPLPVELTSFTAKQSRMGVLLNWITATEVNNYGFDIQRSGFQGTGIREQGFATNWESIGFVAGNGNSNSEKSYSFTDRNVVSATKYKYRLKQIDTDGSVEYSKEIEITTGTPDRFELAQNYPNPFNPGTVINYQLPVLCKVTLKLYDMLGNEILTLADNEQAAGVYSIPVNFANGRYASGTYFYRLTAAGQKGEALFTSSRKMNLVK